MGSSRSLIRCGVIFLSSFRGEATLLAAWKHGSRGRSYHFLNPEPGHRKEIWHRGTILNSIFPTQTWWSTQLRQAKCKGASILIGCPKLVFLFTGITPQGRSINLIREERQAVKPKPYLLLVGQSLPFWMLSGFCNSNGVFSSSESLIPSYHSIQ